MNHEGEQIFFALECGWKRLSFLEGECLLLERHILVEDRFGKAVNKTFNEKFISHTKGSSVAWASFIES
jgi:hypothetical protein